MLSPPLVGRSSARLRVDVVGGEVKTVVLGAHGRYLELDTSWIVLD